MTPVRPLALMMSPSVLSTAGKAFDLAWLEIAGNYGGKRLEPPVIGLPASFWQTPFARIRLPQCSSGQGSPAWLPPSECAVQALLEWPSRALLLNSRQDSQ